MRYGCPIFWSLSVNLNVNILDLFWIIEFGWLRSKCLGGLSVKLLIGTQMICFGLSNLGGRYDSVQMCWSLSVKLLIFWTQMICFGLLNLGGRYDSVQMSLEFVRQSVNTVEVDPNDLFWIIKFGWPICFGPNVLEFVCQKKRKIRFNDK